MRNTVYFFVDGENLLFRFQEMKSNGQQPRADVKWKPDCFVWTNGLLNFLAQRLLRVYYYGTFIGSDDDLQRLKDEMLIAPGGTHNERIGYLSPVIYKKPARSHKTRIVDIQITIDMLRHASQNHCDEMVLISGDGDFVALIEEAKRYGKRVTVMSLSSGLSPQLRACADNFRLLDKVLFE